MSKAFPQYLQRKIIEAAIITSVADDVPNVVTLGLDTGALVEETGQWYERMLGNLRKRPLVGCYYVKYPDGYTSVSPAGAFEGGNVAIAALRDQGLKIEVEGGRLVISVGIDCLAQGSMKGPNWEADLMVVDNDGFAAAVAAHLSRRESHGEGAPELLEQGAHAVCQDGHFSVGEKMP